MLEDPGFKSWQWHTQYTD